MSMNSSCLNIPSWFSLAKYESSYSESLIEWAFNIEVRRSLLHWSSPSQQWHQWDQWDEASWVSIIEHGFLPRAVLRGMYEDEKSFFDQQLKLEAGKTDGVVYGLTLARAYEISEMIESKEYLRQVVSEAKNRPFYETPLSADEQTANSWFDDTFRTERYDDFFSEYGDFCPHICVELTLPDEVIEAAFKKWLLNTRERIAQLKSTGAADAPTKRFSERTIRRWKNAAILPYLDLTIYGQMCGQRLPLHVMGNAIFPTQKDIDTTEAVRKTTKLLAKAAMEQCSALLQQGMIDESGSYTECKI